MKRNFLRVSLFAAALALVSGGAAFAQPTPAPSPKALATKAAPNSFTYGAYVRGFYFTRLNNAQLTTKNPLNQGSWNGGVSIHGGYDFGGGFSAAGTYFYADPFAGSCDTAASHAAGAPCVHANSGAQNATTNPDDTLPGFRMSTLYEAYVQYKDPLLFVRLGNQVINTPWANASDSRLKPVAFQGGDLSYKFSKNLIGEAMYMDRFESRVSSDFLNSTFLTATKIPDVPGAGANLHIPAYTAITTSGFGYGKFGYVNGGSSANLQYYAFADIANALWFDAKYAWKGAVKPFLAVQAGTEQNAGSAVIGKINSEAFGIQGGISPWKNVDFTLAYNYVPEKSDTMTLPAGVTCSNDAIGGSAVFPYFLPAGGTPQCKKNTDGTATVYYGGWASPYTDGYATDPFYTTSITQGLADRRSPGQGMKVAATVYMFDKRVRFITSKAWYLYGNNAAGLANTQEFDLDGTFFFNPLGKGPYRGFSLRHRYAERTQQLFTTNPDFKYNRTQLEYDF